MQTNYNSIGSFVTITFSGPGGTPARNRINILKPLILRGLINLHLEDDTIIAKRTFQNNNLHELRANLFQENGVKILYMRMVDGFGNEVIGSRKIIFSEAIANAYERDHFCYALNSFVDIPDFEIDDTINDGRFIPSNNNHFSLRRINVIPNSDWYWFINKKWFGDGAEWFGIEDPNISGTWPIFADSVEGGPPQSRFPHRFWATAANLEEGLYNLDLAAAGSEDNAAQWAASFVGAFAWRMINEGIRDLEDHSAVTQLYLPTVEVDIPRATVENLCNTHLDHRGNPDPLVFPPMVIDCARAALMAGQHLILVGPPGCGKTKLAGILAKAAGARSITVTASPHWSTDELIGRYLPDPQHDGKIKFVPGHFLEAILDRRWLIVDEINRSEIDDCFGELFTVLSGHASTLSFKEEFKNDIDEIEWKQIRLNPSSAPQSDDFSKYSVQSSFRLIATMNDKDASRLSNLSYAFQRRFCIVRIENISPGELGKLSKEYIEKRCSAFNNVSGLFLPENFTDELIYKATIGRFLSPEMDNWSSAVSIMAKNGVLSPSIIKMAIDTMLMMLARSGAYPDAGYPLVGVGRPASRLNNRSRIIRSCFLSGIAMSLIPQIRSLLGNRPENFEDIRIVKDGLLNFFADTYFGEATFCRIGSDSNFEDTGGLLRDVLIKEFEILLKNSIFLQ